MNQISKSSVAKESSDEQVGRISRYHNRPDSGTSVVPRLDTAKVSKMQIMVDTDYVEPKMDSVVGQSPD